MELVIEQTIYLIISKCGKLIAKGTPRNRYICHVEENDKKRFLTYSTLGRANSAYQNSGFYLSEAAVKYIREKYPETKDVEFISWDKIKENFMTKKFSVKYISTD